MTHLRALCVFRDSDATRHFPVRPIQRIQSDWRGRPAHSELRVIGTNMCRVYRHCGIIYQLSHCEVMAISMENGRITVRVLTESCVIDHAHDGYPHGDPVNVHLYKEHGADQSQTHAMAEAPAAIWKWNKLLDQYLNTSGTRQNRRHFSDAIFKCIFLYEKELRHHLNQWWSGLLTHTLTTRSWGVNTKRINRIHCTLHLLRLYIYKELTNTFHRSTVRANYGCLLWVQNQNRIPNFSTSYSVQYCIIFARHTSRFYIIANNDNRI